MAKTIKQKSCGCGKSKILSNAPIKSFSTMEIGGDSVIVGSREAIHIDTKDRSFDLKPGSIARLDDSQVSNLIEQGAPLWIVSKIAS